MSFTFYDCGLNFSLRLDAFKKNIKELKITTSSSAKVDQENNELSPLALECQKQIKAYLKGNLKDFTLPLSPDGSVFQKEVWQQLAQIPYGETISYKDIAQRIARPRAYQAVGQANGANPIPLIIPCHRVVTHKKGLGGYALGLELKRYFLDLEGVRF